MVAEVTARVFNMVAVLVLWSASLPCPIKYEFDFFLTTCGISLMEQCQWVVMLKLKMIELNVPCAVIFFHDFWFLSSLNYLSVRCSWFVSDFCFVLPSTVWYDLVMMLLCWENPCSFSDSLWCPSTRSNLCSPGFFPSPDVGGLMTSHPCVPHLLGCWTCLGFPRASLSALSTGPTVSWECDTCVLRLSEPKILWNCF